jgi:hexokinase
LTSGDDFIVLVDYIVECVSDFLARVGTQERTVYSMAVSFGFAIKQTGLDKGKLLSLGYGFSYPDGVGVDIVQLMHERVRLKGLPIKIVAIANGKIVMPFILLTHLIDVCRFCLYFIGPRLSAPVHTIRHCT